FAAAIKVVQAVHAVFDVHHGIGQMGTGKRIQGHFSVGETVLDTQGGTEVVVHWRLCATLSARSEDGSVKWKRAPCPGWASAQTRPPCRVTMRRTLARPIPLPGNSEARCRRWNTPNSLPAYCMSKPAPLSLTTNS